MKSDQSVWEVVSDEKKLEQCQKLLEDILTKKYHPRIVHKIRESDPSGDSYYECAYVFPEFNDLWYLPGGKISSSSENDKRRYWNAFGIRKNITDGVTLTADVEINPPVSKIYRMTAGVFVKNHNDIFLGHRGGFGGGKYTQIRKDESFDLIESGKDFNGKILNVIDGDNKARIIIVSTVPMNSVKNDDLQFGYDLQGFVFTVKQLKEKHKQETSGKRVDANESLAHKFQKPEQAVQKKEQQMDEKLIDEIRSSTLSIIPDTDTYIPKPEKRVESVKYENVEQYPRNRETALKALQRANYKCEIDEEHPSFVKKSDGTTYMEPHHLIPMSYQSQFDHSLDVQANIVSLCSNCHNQLHYGRDFESLLRKLYNARKNQLAEAGIQVTWWELIEMYRT